MLLFKTKLNYRHVNFNLGLKYAQDMVCSFICLHFLIAINGLRRWWHQIY